MSDFCQCCLKHKRSKKLWRISDKVKSIFDDLIRSFELNDGYICRSCRRNLKSVNRFKSRISKKHEKNSESHFVPEVLHDFSEEVYEVDNSLLEEDSRHEMPVKKNSAPLKHFEKVQSKMNDLESLIPKEMLKPKTNKDLCKITMTGIVRTPAGVSHFKKLCPVVGCRKTFKIRIDSVRIRHTYLKSHLEKHIRGSIAVDDDQSTEMAYISDDTERHKVNNFIDDDENDEGSYSENSYFVPDDDHELKEYARVKNKMSLLDTIIPKFMRKDPSPDDIRKLHPTDEQGISHYSKMCPVIGCGREFKMRVDKVRIRFDYFKIHLDEHAKRISKGGASHTVTRSSRNAELEAVYFAPEEDEATVGVKLEKMDTGESSLSASGPTKFGLNVPRVKLEPTPVPLITESRSINTQSQSAKNLDKIQCNMCQYSTFSRKNLLNHQNHVHKDMNEFTCVHCQSIFSSYELLQEHRKIHRGQLIHPQKKRDLSRILCTICGKMILKVWIKRHIAVVHEGEKSFVCSDCDKAFSTSTVLSNHRLHHHSGGVRAFQCDLCGRRVASKTFLRKHIFNVHIVEKKNIKCKFCNKGFRTKADLAKHMRRNVHTENELDDGLKANPLTNKFHCSYCDRRYVGKNFLLAHMRKEHS